MPNVSFLWDPADTREGFGDRGFVGALRLESLITPRRNERMGEVAWDIGEFFSLFPATLERRQALFAALLDTPDLFDRLDASFAHLRGLFTLREAREGAMSEEQMLFRIREMEDYVAYLREVREILEDAPEQADVLKDLRALVEPLYTTADFEALCAAVEKQAHDIRHIHSITVGINLDPLLHPVEAGLIEVHDRPFVSGELVSRWLRLSFHEDAFTCSAPLCPTSKKLTPTEQAAMREAVNGALGKVFTEGLRSWAQVIRSHVPGDIAPLAPLLGEWPFIAACVDTLRRLRAVGGALCRPTFGEADCIEGLYHPLVALATPPAGRIVGNELTFAAPDTATGERARLYILTGPNQGGKSVYTQAVGLLYAMLHLGLPLPAQAAVVRLVDGILTHFVDTSDPTYRHGRLSQECALLKVLHRHLSRNSLLLYDEALSGTNATEAVVIARELLSAYATIGARGIFVTHFHDLCRLAEEDDTTGIIANLTAVLAPESHERLFSVVRGEGDGQSYAMDVAREFGLTKEEILRNKQEAMNN